MKLELVEWLDTHASRRWQDLDEVREAAVPLKCRSVGWVFVENEQVIVLVPHFAGVGQDILVQASGDLTIPKAVITKRRVLRRDPDPD
jgi:hypothetical protein